MVIADRAAILVNTVYQDSENYPGFYIAVATLFFSIQVYCDFYGYSTIARGSALMLGIHLMENFDAPYLSRSVGEFWRRWHISLSGWFCDYLYIPLGGNRKGMLRKEVNLLTVFAVSGLWHGASLAYVFWGILNGIYQVMEDICRRGGVWKEKGPEKRFSKRLFHMIRTYLLFCFALIFFRAGSIQEAFELLKNMFAVNNWTILFDRSLFRLGVERNYMNVLLASVLLLFVVDYQKYKERDVAALFLRQGWWFRVSGIMLLLFGIILYGCYGELYDIQEFIYFQF